MIRVLPVLFRLWFVAAPLLGVLNACSNAEAYPGYPGTDQCSGANCRVRSLTSANRVSATGVTLSSTAGNGTSAAIYFPASGDGITDNGSGTLSLNAVTGVTVSSGATLTGSGVVYAGQSNANYLQLSGNGTGNAPAVSAVGSDTNISLAINGKGSGCDLLNTQNTDYLQACGGASGGSLDTNAGTLTIGGTNATTVTLGRSGQVANAPGTFNQNGLPVAVVHGAATPQAIEAGSATLSSGSFAVSFGTAFGAVPKCVCSDTSATAAACNANSIGTGGFTAKGTSSDVVNWICVGTR